MGGEEHIVRQLLTAIDNDSAVSQRSLSKQIGIAVGSVNWYLNRCVGRGWVKLRQVPARRYLYYLTPKGFEAKARLSAAFLQSSFELYRIGREESAAFLKACALANRTRVFLAGDGDLAEIAVLSGLDVATKPCAVVDANSRRQLCAGVPIFASLASAARAASGLPDAVLLTDLERPKQAYRAICTEARELGLEPDIVTAPKILNLGINP